MDGVTNGSPLGQTLANILLSHCEENLLNECPAEFKPIFIEAMSIFCIFFSFFVSPESLHLDREYMSSISSKRQKTNFSLALEELKMVKMKNLLLVFTENQLLLKFPTIIKVSVQNAKKKL